MSQEKIDAYKKEKAGRKERLAKQKVRRKVTKIVSAIVAVALVCGIGVAIYLGNTSAKAADEAEDATAVEEVIDDTTEDAADTEATDAEEVTTDETAADATEVTADETATDTTEVTTDETAADTAETTEATAEVTSETSGN